MKVTNIQWDVDYKEQLEDLPTEMEIPEWMTDEDAISDYISDMTGFCHFGFSIEDSAKNSTKTSKLLLLLGKNNAIEEYIENILKVDNFKDVLYCPSVTTHYTEYGKYVDIAKETKVFVITTQSLEMLDILLKSDLDFDVVTVRKYSDKIKIRTLSKLDVIENRKSFNFDPRI